VDPEPFSLLRWEAPFRTWPSLFVGNTAVFVEIVGWPGIGVDAEVIQLSNTGVGFIGTVSFEEDKAPTTRVKAK
jgi:hypothetical protein